MKKILMFLIILLFVSGCSISSGTDLSGATIKATTVFDDPEYLSLDEVIKLCNEKENIVNENDPFENIIYDETNKQAITKDEINLLTTPREVKNTISKEAAKEDIDLLFRVFKYTYPGYSYFGSENFEAAKEKIDEEISSSELVGINNLIDSIMSNLDFVYDSVFRVMQQNYFYEKEKKAIYQYDDNFILSKDDTGFYKSVDGVKYYVDHFDDERISIELSLLSEGKFGYIPTILTKESETLTSSKVYLNDNGLMIPRSINFKKSDNYAATPINMSDPDIVYQNQDGVAYLAARCFDNEYQQVLNNSFVSTAKDLKNSKYIILDIRSCGGGDNKYIENWLKELLGAIPKHSYNMMSFETGLSDISKYGNETVFTLTNPSHIFENNIPIILLVDSNCTYMAESVIVALSELDNVVVVGTNTSGNHLFANDVELYLPNSGIKVNLPTGFVFYDDGLNHDLIGFNPDIWCDGKEVGALVFTMLKDNSLISEDTCNMFAGNVKKIENLYIDFEGMMILPESQFGGYKHRQLEVYVDDKQITDFTVTCEDKSVSITNNNGLLDISVRDGEFPFTISYNGVDYQFIYVR